MLTVSKRPVATTRNLCFASFLSYFHILSLPSSLPRPLDDSFVLIPYAFFLVVRLASCLVVSVRASIGSGRREKSD